VTASSGVRAPETVTATIEKLATTGEGITRNSLGTGFIAGALAGERVEAAVTEVHPKIWRGRATEILSPSADRQAGPHASCAGCDWAYFQLDRAAMAKRSLFLETMLRLGGLEAGRFGGLPIAASPSGYRLRARFHVNGLGNDVAVGYYARRTHRVESAELCEALSEETRASLPRLRENLASFAISASEISLVEDLSGRRRIGQLRVQPKTSLADARSLAETLSGIFDGFSVVAAGGVRLASVGTPLLWVTINGRDFPLSTDSFFQANRYLAGQLALDVAEQALAPPGRALDAFGGVGLLAGALLERGHRVISVEAHGPAAELAGQTRQRWGLRDDSWTIVGSPILAWIRKERDPLDLAVVDPPRTGLGKELAAAVADRVRDRIIYVSCEPATLARDLAALEARGFRIAHARLYDFFAFTHRVEALVTLERRGSR